MEVYAGSVFPLKLMENIENCLGVLALSIKKSKGITDKKGGILSQKKFQIVNSERNQTV